MNRLLIVVPTLNSYKLLSRLTNSIIKQSWSDWNVLFIDGKSNYKHKEWIKDICNKDSRFKAINQDDLNPGIFGAMNQGFGLCRSDQWLLFWGSDDWAKGNNTFQEIVNSVNLFKESNIEPDIVVCQGRYISHKNQRKKRKAVFSLNNNEYHLNKSKYRNSLLMGNIPPHQATLIGPKARRIINKYSKQFYLAADLDYFLTLSKAEDINVLIINKEIVNMLEGGVSSRRFKQRISEVRRAYKLTFGFIWWFPFIMRYIKRAMITFRQ